MNIEYGILVPSTLRKIGVGITSPDYAIVRISNVSQRCIVKNISNASIAAECLCALLGDALDLPTLSPVIVTHPISGDYLFGSRELNSPNLNNRFNVNTTDMNSLKTVATLLSKWCSLGGVISFDELIENGDRNIGNILYDGENFTIIDHERTLGIDPKQYNKLARLVTHPDLIDQEVITEIEQSSVAISMVQHSMIVENTILQRIKKEALALPVPIKSYFETYISLIEQNADALILNTSNLFSPLFAGGAR